MPEELIVSGEYSSSTDTRKGYITRTRTGDIKEIEYAIVEGRAMFEGDIVIGTEETIAAAESDGALRLESGRVFDSVPESLERGMVVQGCIVVNVASNLWPNGSIPYTIDPGLPNQQRVTDAIDHWEQNTSISFVARQTQNDFVKFIPSNGCWSYVGRQGGQQEIGLASGCSTGNTIHEIGHAVGLWHEQSREDREEYVTIQYENIMEGYEHNFNQHIVDGDDVGPYDYGSIMHYPRTAFSKNGQDTITPLRQGATIGQRQRLSNGDIDAIGTVYGGRRRSWWELILEFLRNLFGG